MAQHDLTQGSISAIILRMAIPSAVGYLFQTFYNIVDTTWASTISPEALAGLGLSFPIFLSVLAIAIGVSAGSTVLTAHALGAKDEAQAGKIIGQTILVGLIASLGLALIGLPLLSTIFAAMSPDQGSADNAWLYFSPILLFNAFFIMSFALNGALNAVGDTLTFAAVLIGGFFLNLGLNPLLIYGYSLGDLTIVPAMGTMGIGIATVISQGLGMAFVVYRLSRLPLWGHVMAAGFAPRREVIMALMKQGLPASFNMVAIALGFVLMTYYSGRFGTDALAGFTAGLRIEQLALLPAVGLNTACMALVGQNMGAKNYGRAWQSFYTTIIYGTVILNVGALFIYLFAQQLMSLIAFGMAGTNPAVIEFGTTYLRYISFEYAALCFIMIGGGFLQAIKRPIISTLITIPRICVVPFFVFPFFAFTLDLGFAGIWIAVLCSSFFFAFISIAAVLYYKNKLLNSTDA